MLITSTGFSRRALQQLQSTSAFLRPLKLESYNRIRTIRSKPNGTLYKPYSSTTNERTQSNSSSLSTAKSHPPSNFGSLDVLGNTPTPASALTSCHADGFTFESGLTVESKSLLILGGEVFTWSRWTDKKMPLNIVGQLEIPIDTLTILQMIWPKPDIFIIGTGAKNQLLSPNTRKYLNSLGMRVEAMDTRNAAAQYNLLATERGINEIGGLLVPSGWEPTI